MWQNWNPCALLVWMWSGAVAMENSRIVPQKLKNRITLLLQDKISNGRWHSALGGSRLQVCSGPIPQSSQKQDQVQWMCHHLHAGLPGQEHENQVPGADLSLLPAHQVIWDYWLFWGHPLTGEVLKTTLLAKADPHWPVDQVQGTCYYQGLQWLHQSGWLLQGGRPHICGVITLLSIIPMQQGSKGTRSASSTLCTTSDWLLQLCADAPHPRPQRHWQHLRSCTQKAAAYTWYSWLLHLSQGLHYPLSNCAKATFEATSKIFSYLISSGKTVYQISQLGIHWPSSKDLHQSLCAKDAGSNSGYHVVLLYRKNKVNNFKKHN